MWPRRILDPVAGFISRIRESGGTVLTAGTIADLEFLRRSGTTFAGIAGIIGTGIKTLEIIRKTADNAAVNNSTVLVDDAHLFASIAANETVFCVFVVGHIGNSAADIRFAVTAPAGAAGKWGVPNAAVGADDLTRTAAWVLFGTAVGFQGDATDRVQLFVATVRNGATAGSVKLQFAQNTAAVVDTKTLTDSFLVVLRQ